MRHLALLAVVAMALPTLAGAQSPGPAGCTQQARSVCAPAGAPGAPPPSVRLLDAKGDVLVSRGAGFSEIAPGAELAVGDRLLIGGGADLALGGACAARFGADAMVTVIERDGQVCAARLSGPETAPAGGFASSLSTPVVAGVGLGVIAGGALLATQLKGDDKAPTPVSR